MSNTLYLECYSGISGDMTVASLLDLGADEKTLTNALDSLNLKGYNINISRVKKAGLDVCDFDVILDKEHENHDHDMEVLHGHNHNNIDHEKGTVDGSHTHMHRGIEEILSIIRESNITDRAKSIASKIFEILAEAEAKAHGVDITEVHFHEVGAVDSIVDIVAVAVCLDNLGITEVIVPNVYEGRGVVRCQHGTIPIPVPAVVNIASSYNISLHITDTQGELVTPTGAAIIAAIRTLNDLPKNFVIKKTGIGAGKRNYDRPSVLRAMLIEDSDKENIKKTNTDCNYSQTDECIYKLESNIDDCTGENLGYVMNKLLESGARDVYYSPIYMKKNRPAYQLNVICEQSSVSELEGIIFEETTTIGIRRIKVERTVLNRRIVEIDTSLGEVQVKVCELDFGERYYPEYDSIVKICKKHNISYQKAYRTVICELEKKVR